jgi:hypothetical protein
VRAAPTEKQADAQAADQEARERECECAVRCTQERRRRRATRLQREAGFVAECGHDERSRGGRTALPAAHARSRCERTPTFFEADGALPTGLIGHAPSGH